MATRPDDCSVFTIGAANLETLKAATSLIEKIENLRRQFDNSALENLRQSVLQMKIELVMLADRERTEKKRLLAQEVAQWLTVWLQNPQIFGEWLELRRDTVEFRERFG